MEVTWNFRLIQDYRDNPEELDINCVDPLNRSALIAAIENENIELIRLLLDEGIKVKDALLHSISEEYVEAVETLLQWEEQNHEPGTPYVSMLHINLSKAKHTHFNLNDCNSIVVGGCRQIFLYIYTGHNTIDISVP